MKPLALILITIFVAGIILIVANPDILNNVTNSFIDTSGKVTTLMTYWANGGQVAQPSATSGSENVNFAEVIEVIEVPNNGQDGTIGNDVRESNISNEVVTSFSHPDTIDISKCEETFKICIDKVHTQYGTYIEVKDIYIAETVDKDYIKAAAFYNNHKSEYQSSCPLVNNSYPALLIWGSAAGLGDFVAICKDGSYPVELNEGLPC